MRADSPEAFIGLAHGPAFESIVDPDSVDPALFGDLLALVYDGLTATVQQSRQQQDLGLPRSAARCACLRRSDVNLRLGAPGYPCSAPRAAARMTVGISCVSAREPTAHHYGMCRPEMLRATTRRWISEVPSKIV